MQTQKGFDVVNLHGTASGVIATPYIGENENWWIGNEDTGINARGEKGDQGEPGPNGPAGPQGVQGPAGTNGLFSAMDVLFDGIADIQGNTYSLNKPITDYKIMVVEYGFYDTILNKKSSCFEWIVCPHTSDSPKCYRGIRMIGTCANVENRIIVFWHFPTVSTFVLGEKITIDPASFFGITKIYGIK